MKYLFNDTECKIKTNFNIKTYIPFCKRPPIWGPVFLEYFSSRCCEIRAHKKKKVKRKMKNSNWSTIKQQVGMGYTLPNKRRAHNLNFNVIVPLKWRTTRRATPWNIKRLIGTTENAPLQNLNKYILKGGSTRGAAGPEAEFRKNGVSWEQRQMKCAREKSAIGDIHDISLYFPSPWREPVKDNDCIFLPDSFCFQERILGWIGS